MTYFLDVSGGIMRINPPADNRLELRWQGVGHTPTLRPIAHLAVSSDSDWPDFDVKTVLAFSVDVPEAKQILNDIFDETYSASFIDFQSTNYDAPIVFDPAPGVTVTPADGLSLLTFQDEWRLVYLVKADANSWTAHGDLVAA